MMQGSLIKEISNMIFLNIFYSLNYLKVARNETDFYCVIMGEEKRKKIRN
jgi:hypothetical protein